MLTVIQKFSHSLCHSGQIVRTSSISDWHLTTRKEGMVATYRTLKEASPSTQRCEFPSTLAAANLLFACDQQQNVIGHGVGGFVRRSQPKKIQVFMTNLTCFLWPVAKQCAVAFIRSSCSSWDPGQLSPGSQTLFHRCEQNVMIKTFLFNSTNVPGKVLKQSLPG